MITKAEKRTLNQNKALHLWLEQVAAILNERGITLKAITERLPEAECPATKENLKELVWRPIQRNLFYKQSTRDLSKTKEIDAIYDTLNKFFAENFEVSLPPFPSYESVNFTKTYDA